MNHCTGARSWPGRLFRPVARVLVAALIAGLASAGMSSLSFGWALGQLARAEAPPLVGFSFNPVSAAFYGDEPVAALTSLLNTFDPDLVRLPVAWDRVEPSKSTFDYAQLDRLLAAVRRHNSLLPARPAHVILVVGARNFGYPEVHVPAWLAMSPGESVGGILSDAAYMTYFRHTVSRYANENLLAAWQVENEALDNVKSPVAAATDVPAEDLQEEIAMVHRLDTDTPVIVTTYNNSALSLDLEQLSAPNARRFDESGATPVGHPQRTMQLADVLGIDAYVATGSTSLADADVAKRVAWKVASLQYWADEARAAGKPMWITEMQGEAWVGMTNFSPSDLVLSAREYRGIGATAVLLWGVEGWLHDPAWMAAGMQARSLLASTSPELRGQPASLR